MTILKKTDPVSLFTIIVFGIFFIYHQGMMNPHYSSIDQAFSLAEGNGWGLLHPELWGYRDVGYLDGRFYSLVPPLPSLLLVPVIFVFKFLLYPVSDIQARYHLLYGISYYIYALPLMVLTAKKFYRLSAEYCRSESCRRWSVLFFLCGTGVFTLGIRFFSYPLIIAATVWGYEIYFRSINENRLTLGRGLVTGLLAGILISVRYYEIIVFLPLVLHSLVRFRRGFFTGLMLGIALHILLVGWYQYEAFGDPMKTGYQFTLFNPDGVAAGEKPVTDDTMRYRLTENFASVVRDRFILVAGNLLSPLMGYFIYIPLFLAGVVYATRRFITRREWKWGLPTFVLIIYIVAIFFLKLNLRLSHTFVNRYLVLTTPFLVLASAPLFESSRGRLAKWFTAASIFVVGYLPAQTGYIPTLGSYQDFRFHLFCLKTFLSSFGLPSLFQYEVPGLLGIKTLHGVLASPEFGPGDIFRLLSDDPEVLWGTVYQVLALLFVVFILFCAFRMLFRGDSDGST